MPSYASYDGTEIGYHLLGDGAPLVCLPGGPGRAAEYLGDLGGLNKSRQLVLVDHRGVGTSADPADPATFRADRLVDDVEALRAHLGLDQMDLLAHSAGAVLATLYAARYPDRISRLVLITPGLAAVDISETEEGVRGALARRTAEPWYPAALAALEQIFAGSRSMEDFRASRPFYYARWDQTTKAHSTSGVSERHQAAREGYFADLELDPPATRAAMRKLTAPVLLYGGEMDPMVTPAVIRAAALLFNDPTVVIQPDAAHFPWLENPAAFAAAVGAFLS